MTQLRMNFGPVYKAFAREDVAVTDMWGYYSDGVWVEDEIIEHRTVKAVRLQLSPEDLKFYSDGNASSGGISLITKEELYFTDINATEQTQKQSYVVVAGYRFRVMGTGFFENNTTYHQYNCIRYFV